jgi:DNA-binding GntR family transcriptional regulator
VTSPTPEAASARVAAVLRAEILDGRLSPGTRIRQEEVADRLGSSRLPVREALRMLDAEGLVVIEPNRGARIPVLDRDEVEVLYRMRERLEPLALIESMPRLSVADVERILELQTRIESVDDIRDFLVLDREFHLATYSACPVDHLQESVARLWNATQHYRRAFMTLAGQERRWVVNAEHALLVDAIRRADPTDAERYLVGHIRRTRRELVSHPEVFATGA